MNDSPNLQPSNGQRHQNGNGNGNGNGRSTSAQLAASQGGVALQAPSQNSAIEKKEQQGNEIAPQNVFDQPIILKQPAYWSRAILWTIMVVTALSVGVAWFGKVEEAIPAQGQLEPEGQVQDVQAPAGGVVQEILVEDGDLVEEGQTLIRLDPEVSEAELASLVAIKQSTIVENDFYSAELYGQTITSPETLAQLEIPPFYTNLTLELKELKQREVVFNNYMVYLDQLAVAPVPPVFSGPLQELARAVWEQYSQVGQQIRGAQAQLLQLEQQIGISQKRIEIAEQSQVIEGDIVNRIRPLVEDGVLAEIQLERQQNEFLDRQNEVGARYAELENLIQQQAGLFAELGASRDQQEGIVASARADARGQLNNIVDRKQQITSDLNNRIITNNNRLAELEAQIEQAQTQLEYQEIRSPIDGVVFDVQPQVQGLVNPNAPEPVLKVVPDDALIATIFLPNQDVGFVLKALEEKGTSADYDLKLIDAQNAYDVPTEGNGTVFAVKLNRGYHIRIFDLAGNMLLDKTPRQFKADDDLMIKLDNALEASSLADEREANLIKEVTTTLEYPLGVRVDVRIDSFPFNEFRDIDGEVIWIGDDALEPDQVYQFFRFPAKIKMDSQVISVEGAEVQLQSGMSINANIKTRKRRIITLFMDKFLSKIETLREP